MFAKGFFDCRHLAPLGGFWDDSSIRLALEYFDVIRSTSQASVQMIPPAYRIGDIDDLLMYAYGIESMTVNQIKTQTDSTKNKGAWQSFYLHQVDVGAITSAQFSEMVEYVNDQDIPVRTVGNVFDMLLSGQNIFDKVSTQDVFMDVLAESPNSVYDYSAADTNTHTITYINDPDVPRSLNVSIRNDSGGALNISTATCTIIGYDARGKYITEIVTIPATVNSANGTSTSVKTRNAFADVVSIKYSAAQATTKQAVGITDYLGLSKCFTKESDVFTVKRNTAKEAIGLVDPWYGTVDLSTITVGDDFSIGYYELKNAIIEP